MKTNTINLVTRIGFASFTFAALAAFAPAQTVDQKIATLQARCEKLEKMIATLNAQDIQQSAQLSVLELKTKYMSVVGTTTKFTGTNVQIVKDPGNFWAPNGLGNLIVGYNNLRTDGKPTVRTGSHNLVLGNENSYASAMGFVGGFRNSIDGQFSSILTGRDGIISKADDVPAFNAIITGKDQRVRGHFSGLLTGIHNVVDTDYSGILTGFDNKIGSGDYNLILSGETNRSYGNQNVVLTGFSNTTYGLGNVIGTGISSNLGHPVDYNQWYRFKSN